MAQWIKTEVRRLISDAVAPVVSAAGFRFKKSLGAFTRRIGGGRQEFGLALVDYNPIFELSFTLCIRLEAVQEITNQFSGSLQKYHGMTMTSITQLEFLGLPADPGRGVVYQLKSESDLTAILPKVLTMVRERVLPFFEEYHNMAAVNRGMNPEGAERVFRIGGFPDRRAFDATNQPYRAMTGVTIAHLAHDPRLAALIAAYRGQISEMPEHDRLKFETLVRHLDVASFTA